MNKKTSILIVDDEPTILDVYSAVLRKEGYEVWQATTGQECLQVVRERRPDLVLLDVMLPDFNGMEVCRQIKADAALADVFVVLASGTATSAARKVDGLDVGADDYLTKPLAMAEFLARIRTIVRLRNTTAALRASEQQHRQLVEILPEAVGLIDLQGRFLALNPHGAEMFGYANSGEWTERSVFDLARTEDHERFRAELTATLQSGALRNAEYVLRRNRGGLFHVEVSAAMAADADGQPSGIVLVARDTTERKRAEKQIRILADAMQSTQELICIMDEENRITFANRAFLQAYGYTAEEIMGRTPDFLYSAKNPAELEKISLLTPVKQLVAIGKIESTLQPFGSRSPASDAPKAGDKPGESDGKGAKPAPSTDTGFAPSKGRSSDAPVIKPLNGEGRAVEPEPGSMSTREMIQAYQKAKGLNLAARKRH